MSDLRDQLIDVLLREELGGESPPDLTGRIVDRAFQQRRKVWVPAILAAAAVVFACVSLGWLLLRQSYPLPQASGQYEVVGGGDVRPGSVLRVKDQPAALVLGGYARVEIKPNTTLRLEGGRGTEEIFLDSGEVRCEVDRDVGTFAVRTQVGTVSVTGTEFIVQVTEQKENHKMFDQRMMVRVLVGAVLVSGAWGNVTLAAAVAPGMSDREKALAIWFQQIRQRFHRAGKGEELGNPVKVYNVYGHNPCGSDACIMGGLWRKAGLKGAPVRLVSHAIAQVSYDGAWHVMDGDLDNIFLLRDNETVASDRELARDHDLVKRTHTFGILLADNRARDEATAAMFVCEDEIKGERNCYASTMDMTLRPGEALVWRWGHLSPAKYMWNKMQPNYPDTICNGLWEYRPDFTKDTWRKGADRVEGVVAGPDGLAAEAGKTGTIIWKMHAPYPFVGGRYEVQGQGTKIAFSNDGKEWREMTTGILDYQFPSEWGPWYEYRLKCTLASDARLKGLRIVNDLQMALLALPEMVVGENAFTYTDQSPGERKLRITHEWVERSASKPPEAPPSPVYPPDGGETNGTDIVFQWQAPSDPDGDRIADYHFELSNRTDMRWPLSMTFYKLVSRTADRGKTQYTLPYVGLLAPDKQYYWHVRAKDEKGVWGPWSKTWSFAARGPAYPLEVTLDYDQNKNLGTLKWEPNRVGRKPAKYRVYGSDEKGFSVSDEPYKVNIGVSKELNEPTPLNVVAEHPEMRQYYPAQHTAVFPANFIAETTAAELPVLGPEVALPAANKTCYRVVAVDEQGNRSGPSDYAAAPRPVIYTKPVAMAKVGAQYRYQAACNRSLGDLRLHSPETASFWDIEKPKYNLEQGPKWLKLDPATGMLTGTPDAAGKAEVVVSATIEREVRKLDESALGWGQEKVVSTSTEKLGPATQKFVIEISQ